MALSLAMMVGPWAGTVVMDRFGSRVLWISVFACGLATAGIFGLVVSPGVRSARTGETA